MKEEVFTGTIDELLKHATDNDESLAGAAEAEVVALLQEELDQMVEDGLIECVDGKYRAIDA
jgi:hypothetical protein